MSPRKTAVAALAFMATGISAIGAHAPREITVTAEPQFVGSSASNGVLLYTFDLCTTVQSTTCAVTVSTGAASASPEYTTRSPAEQSTTVTVTAPGSNPSQSENQSATSLAAGTVASDPPHWTPDPTASQSAAPDVGSTSPSVVVVSTTDAAGSPTSLTSTVSPAAHGTTGRSSSSSAAASVSSLSSGHSSGGRTTSSSSSSSVSLSKTGGVPNATVTGSHEPSSASTAAPSAPSKTGAASARVIPAMALGAVMFVTTMFII